MAEDPETGQEKKYAPTERRLEKAREDGQVARSSDTVKVVLFTVFFLLLLIPGADLVHSGVMLVTEMLDRAGTESIHSALHETMHLLGRLSALLIMLGLCGVFAGFVPGGVSASAKSIQPKPSKLNPIKGAKNIFSPKRVTETLKSLVKFLLIGGTGLTGFMIIKPTLVGLPQTAAPNWVWGLHTTVWIFGLCIVPSIMIVAFDIPFQDWNHRRELRMTEKEVRDEGKETDVDPETKKKQQQAAQRAARDRMMEELPQASATVVNPEHFAVAIRYREGRDAAPVVVASGRGRLAARIVKRSRRHIIPVVSAPPLARALHRACPPGEQVPPALYTGCAAVLAYVWRLHLAISGQGDMPAPPTESELEVDRKYDPITANESD